jgi:pimeloyl-ACP methyl ester carboxylesterase
MKSKRKRRIIKFSAIGLGVILVIYIGLSIFGAIQAMEIPRLPLDDSPDSLGLEYEDVAFTSREDNVLLKGWFLPAGGEHAIIIVHGGFQNRLDDTVNTMWLAHDLVEKEYDVLLFDLRGRGESEGKGLTLSNIDRDIGGAVDYIKGRGYSAESIYIIGFCSGAASSCIFASQNDIGALVLDGCFATVTGMVKTQAGIMGIPTFLVDFFTPGVLVMTKLIYGYDLVNAIDVIADVDCPIFFIHEANDELISFEEMQRLYQLAPNPANQFWEVSDAAHSQSYKTHPADYIEMVDGFFSTKAEDVD